MTPDADVIIELSAEERVKLLSRLYQERDQIEEAFRRTLVDATRPIQARIDLICRLMGWVREL